MALDRFVYFHFDDMPKLADVGFALEDYLGNAAESVEWSRDRWIATLKGTHSHPFRRVANQRHNGSMMRWFEVHVGNNNLDIITRQQDELTNVVAQGFAELVARYWHGRLEDA